MYESGVIGGRHSVDNRSISRYDYRPSVGRLSADYLVVLSSSSRPTLDQYVGRLYRLKTTQDNTSQHNAT